MDGEYRSLKNQGFETSILFFGQENCLPNYFFKGNNVRDNYVVHYVQSGKGVFSVANHYAVKLEAGDMFILPKGVPCFYQADGDDPWSYFWIGFSGIKTNSLFRNSKLLNKGYLRNVKHSETHQSLKKLYETAHHSASLTNDVLIESLIYNFFYHLITEFPEKTTKTSKNSDKLLKVATDHFSEQYNNSKCSVNSICNELDVSRSFLYTLFKNYLNTSPRDFLIKLRMEKAKEYLDTTDYSIQQISNYVGYTDEFTFSKAFKRYTDFSPLNYRKQNK